MAGLKVETVEEYLERGGKITVIPPGFTKEGLLLAGDASAEDKKQARKGMLYSSQKHFISRGKK